MPTSAQRDALEKKAEAWNTDLGNRLDAAHSQLQHDKADRNTLANILANAAKTIGDSPE